MAMTLRSVARTAGARRMHLASCQTRMFASEMTPQVPVGTQRSMSTNVAQQAGVAEGKDSASLGVLGHVGVPTLHVGVVGYGLVGQELVSQVLASSEALRSEMGIGVEVSAVAYDQGMHLLDSGKQAVLEGGAWPTGDEPPNLEKLGQHLLECVARSGGRAIIVDNTAADVLADFYEGWLAAGIDIATPNKKAGSGPYSRYEKIIAAQRKGGSRFLYECTVGAGLPIIAPLQNLRRAGDKVFAVEGIFSGTLSYIFNTWKPGMKFSAVVADARAQGFTEPDPRDDLGGVDVQRKVVILAREMGLKLELDDVPVESLVPEQLRDWKPPAGVSVGDAFLAELDKYDDEMTALIEEAEAANEVLRFVGTIDMRSDSAFVKLGRFPKDHAFATTQHADNIVTIDSKWYTPRPLVVQGPGAGAAVTAAGVYGNIMDSMVPLMKPAM